MDPGGLHEGVGPKGPGRHGKALLVGGGLVVILGLVVLLVIVPGRGKGPAITREPSRGTGNGLALSDAARNASEPGAGDRASAETAQRAVEPSSPPRSAQSRPEVLHGRVVDADSRRPVTLFRIFARPVCGKDEMRRYAADHPEGGRARRDDNGSFRLRGLEPGSYTLLVAALGYEPAVVQATLPRAEPLEIVVSHGACARGIVRDRRGRPVARVPVFIDPLEILDPADPPPQWRIVETDGEGHFLFPRLSPGRYVLCMPRHGENQTAPFDVSEGERTEHDLVLPFNNALRISVTDPDGKPLRGAELILRGPSDESTIQTDVDGLATCRWLKAGSWVIEARYRGRRSEIRTLDMGDYGRSELTIVLGPAGHGGG